MFQILFLKIDLEFQMNNPTFNYEQTKEGPDKT